MYKTFNAISNNAYVTSSNVGILYLLLYLLGLFTISALIRICICGARIASLIFMSIFAAYGYDAVSPPLFPRSYARSRRRARHFSCEFSENEVSTLAGRRLSDKIIHRRGHVCFNVDTCRPRNTLL